MKRPFVNNVINAIMDTPGEAKYGFTREQLTEGFMILREK